MFSINHLIIGVPNDLTHTVPISQALEVNSPYGAFFFPPHQSRLTWRARSRCAKRKAGWLSIDCLDFCGNMTSIINCFFYHGNSIIVTFRRSFQPMIVYSGLRLQSRIPPLSSAPSPTVSFSVPAPLHLILKPWVLSSCGRNPCNLGCEGNGLRYLTY